MKNIFTIFIIFVIAVAFISLSGCSCEKKDPTTAPVMAPGDGGNKIFGDNNRGDKTAPKWKNVGKTQNPVADKFGPLLQKSMSLPKYDSNPESCQSFCKHWCPLAAKCNWKIMAKPVACHKLCVNPCTKGMLPKGFADCINGANDCNAVQGCFKELKTEIQKAAGATAPTAPEGATGAEASPAAPVTSPGTGSAPTGK